MVTLLKSLYICIVKAECQKVGIQNQMKDFNDIYELCIKERHFMSRQQ